MKLVFIAGSFSGGNAWEVACNAHEAEAAALSVAQLGGMPVVPHLLGQRLRGALPEESWRAGCLAQLARCDGILLLPSWGGSPDALAESNFAQHRGIERWGIAHLTTPEFIRWLVYPAERGASIKAAIEAGKAGRR